MDAISSLLNGARLWDDGGSEAMQKFGVYIKQNWLIVVTNTQLVERWVKDSNECTHSVKDDHIASLIAICRSTTVFEYKYESKQLAKERTLRGNQHYSAGKLGVRTCITTGRLEGSEA